MSYSIPIAQALKRIPARTVGRVTVNGHHPCKMTFRQFLDYCPYTTVEYGQNDGPELKTCGYFELFFHYAVNGKEYQYHICEKYDYGKKNRKYEYVYPTKQTSDYVGGVTYTSKGREYI